MNYIVKVYKQPNIEGVVIRFIRWESHTNYEVLNLASGEWVSKNLNTVYEPGDGFSLVLGEFEGLAQKLADALYGAGIAPSPYVPSVGEKETALRHLNDMRAIVANQLNMKLP